MGNDTGTASVETMLPTLVAAGVTDTCGMALLLSKLPYNRQAGCDIDAVLAALRSGDGPPNSPSGCPLHD